MEFEHARGLPEGLLVKGRHAVRCDERIVGGEAREGLGEPGPVRLRRLDPFTIGALGSVGSAKTDRSDAGRIRSPSRDMPLRGSSKDRKILHLIKVRPI